MPADHKSFPSANKMLASLTRNGCGDGSKPTVLWGMKIHVSPIFTYHLLSLVHQATARVLTTAVSCCSRATSSLAVPPASGIPMARDTYGQAGGLVGTEVMNG